MGGNSVAYKNLAITLSKAALPQPTGGFKSICAGISKK